MFSVEKHFLKIDSNSFRKQFAGNYKTIYWENFSWILQNWIPVKYVICCIRQGTKPKGKNQNEKNQRTATIKSLLHLENRMFLLANLGFEACRIFCKKKPYVLLCMPALWLSRFCSSANENSLHGRSATYSKSCFLLWCWTLI